MNSSSTGDVAEGLDRLAEDLASSNRVVVERAVHRIRMHLPRMDDAPFRRAVDALCSLFYVDTGDRPDLEPALDDVTDVLSSQGPRVVPLLLGQMVGSDLKSHLYLARTLARMGCDALIPLRNLMATAEDPYARTFALFAIGKMTCPEVADALPEVVGGLMHPDKEVRDTAARTLGRIVVTVPEAQLTPRRRREIFDALLRATRDHQPAVRAKAIRSLGKMVTARLLTAAQERQVAVVVHAALGTEEERGWDHAFIVRKEARETLATLKGS